MSSLHAVRHADDPRLIKPRHRRTEQELEAYRVDRSAVPGAWHLPPSPAAAARGDEDVRRRDSASDLSPSAALVKLLEKAPSLAAMRAEGLRR